jgi:hypothetical protein
MLLWCHVELWMLLVRKQNLTRLRLTSTMRRGRLRLCNKMRCLLAGMERRPTAKISLRR